MARNTSNKSSDSKNKKTTGKAPVKNSPSSKSKVTKGGSARRTSTKNQPAAQKISAKRSQPAKREPSPVREGLSLDRKLDIIGIVLTLLGFLTLLSLFSASHGSLTGGVVTVINQAFGSGMYLFPLVLVITGLWLVLRNFDRIPQVAFERLLGFLLLFTNALVVLHLLEQPASREISMALAEFGDGGGYVGAVILEGMRATLGIGGAIIALVAWLLIGLTLALDTSVMEILRFLLRWVPPIATKLQAAAVQAVKNWQAQRARRVEAPPTGPALTEFRPVSTGSVQAASALGHSQAGVPTAAVSQAPGSVEAEPRQWVLPPVQEILDPGVDAIHDDELNVQRAHVIEETLTSFGAPARVIEINPGPTITQFGVEPDFIESRGGKMRVRVSKISALADDLALALAARTIRIQAPVPGKGFVGIEVPNDEIARVALRDLVENQAFQRMHSPLRFALGQNVSGNAVAADLAAMPHLLIAGATGSGKSVCVNALICCLLLNNTPDDLRLIMVDPKRVELTGYNGIPHLLAPVVVDLERVVGALQWVTREMDMRYRKMADIGARNIQDYNNKMLAGGQKKLPYLVVIIDELADLMMLAPDETERNIARLAQLARATGIHLVIATQRPSVDVVTGLIKANFPARIAFAVASNVDSRTILDQPGAERLLGRGDMLFQAPDAPAPVRLQGVYVSDSEIQRLVQYWQGFSSTAETTPVAVGGAPDSLPSGIPLKQIGMFEEMAAEEESDPLLNEATDLVRRQGRASISMLQRRLRIGYTRAARLVETMEEKGIVGPPEAGTGTREVLDYGQAAPPVEELRE